MKILFIISILLIAQVSFSQELLPYQPFDQAAEEIELYTYRGEYVVLRVAEPIDDSATLEYLMDALDDGYLAAIDHVGEEPRPFSPGNLDGLLSIAQVTPPCGFSGATACGFIGATGIELGDFRMEQMIDAAGLEKIESTVFYEYGRNFLLYGKSFAFSDGDQKGAAGRHFAHLFRFRIPEYLNLTLGPDNQNIYNNRVVGVLEEYSNNSSQCFTDTLRPPTNDNFFSYLDSVLVSIFYELKEEYGEEFALGMYNELREIGFNSRREITQSDKETDTATTKAIDNFVIAASLAANDNLVTRFREEWKFPVTRVAEIELGVEQTVPDDPSITCGLQNVGGLAGSFFNPQTSGEGYFVNVTSDNQLFIAWFGNSIDGEPLWLASNVINIENLQWGDEVELTMSKSNGGDFQQPISGGDPWGKLTIRWDSCDEVRAVLEGDDGTKSQDLVRLTDTKGVSCNGLTSQDKALTIDNPDTVFLQGMPVGITY